MRRLYLSEETEQIALIQWCKYHPILKHYLIAIPNGGWRHKVTAVKLKRQGVKAGVSDLFLAYPVAPYHGAWLELKRAKPATSHLSAAQKDWIELMEHIKFKCYVAYGWVAAKDCLLEYLNEERSDSQGITGETRD
jgi:hypothetical protein